MLRLMGWAGVALGVVALLVGVVVLFQARQEIVLRDFSARVAWNPIGVMVGLNMLVGGVLTALLGAIGLGVADLQDGQLAEAHHRAEAEFATKRRAEEARIEAALAPVLDRLNAEHGPVIAATAVRHLAEARTAGRHMREADAVARAKADIERAGRATHG
jgi:hypothetical protein